MGSLGSWVEDFATSDWGSAFGGPQSPFRASHMLGTCARDIGDAKLEIAKLLAGIGARNASSVWGFGLRASIAFRGFTNPKP